MSTHLAPPMRQHDGWPDGSGCPARTLVLQVSHSGERAHKRQHGQRMSASWQPHKAAVLSLPPAGRAHLPGGKDLEMTLAAPLLALLANFSQMATLMQAALLERHKPNPHNIAVLTWLSSQRWSRPPFLSQKGNVLCSHCCTSRSISAAWLTRGPAQASSASPTDALSTETYVIVATQGKQDLGKLAESLHHGQNLPQPVSGPQAKHKRGQ